MGELAKTGVQETKDVLAFALTLGNSLAEALKDGKISMTEVPGFLPAAMKLPAALTGISQVPAEISHLDDAEKEEIFAFIQTEFQIGDDKIEGAVLDGLKLVGDIHGYVKKYFVKAEAPAA